MGPVTPHAAPGTAKGPDNALEGTAWAIPGAIRDVHAETRLENGFVMTVQLATETMVRTENRPGGLFIDPTLRVRNANGEKLHDVVSGSRMEKEHLLLQERLKGGPLVLRILEQGAVDGPNVVLGRIAATGGADMGR